MSEFEHHESQRHDFHVDHDQGSVTISDDRPLVLLDVDGVVNAWPRYHAAKEYLWLNSQGMRVAVHPDTIEALAHVLKAAQEIVWCTAWRWWANREISAFLSDQIEGWPDELEVVSDISKEVFLGGNAPWAHFHADWKLDAVRNHDSVRMAKWHKRPVIWIEDFGFGLRGSFGRAYQEEVRETDVLAMDTAAEGRLTTTHIERMERREWIR